MPPHLWLCFSSLGLERHGGALGLSYLIDRCTVLTSTWDDFPQPLVSHDWCGMADTSHISRKMAFSRSFMAPFLMPVGTH